MPSETVKAVTGTFGEHQNNTTTSNNENGADTNIDISKSGGNTASASVLSSGSSSQQDGNGITIAPGMHCVLSGLTRRQDLNNQRCVVVRRKENTKKAKSCNESSQTWVVELMTNKKRIAVGAHRLILDPATTLPPPQKNSEQTTATAAPTSTAPTLSRTITVGTNCILHGLHRRTDLNGRRCVALRRSKKNPEKWVVQIVANNKYVEASERHLEIIDQDGRFPSTSETSTAATTPNHESIFVCLSAIVAGASAEQIDQWQQEVNVLEEADYQKGCAIQGISYPLLRDLSQFITKNHPDWSTYDFCEKYVKPITAQFQCSLLNLLNVIVPTTTIQLLGVISKQATIFVSHAWKYNNSRLLSCLVQLDNADNDFFWIDTLTVTQHKRPGKPAREFQWWCDTFQKSVELIGRTVLVLQPFTDPIPLKRSWCLFEIFCSHNAANVRFDIVLDEEEEKAFSESLTNGNFKMHDWVAKIDLSTAEAGDPVDQENILKRVNATSGGVQRLNEIVMDVLREWFAKAGRALSASVRHNGKGGFSEKSLQSQLSVAQMLRSQGKLAEAETLFRQLLAEVQAELGESHLYTLAIMGDLVNLLDDQGKFREAEAKGRKVMVNFQARLGEAHDYTLAATNVLAAVLRQQSKFAEAEGLYRKVLRIRTAKFGAGHPDTLGVMANLADSLDEQQKFGEAEVLYQSAIAGLKATAGKAHPRTLMAMSNYAELLRKQNKLAAAEILQRQVLAARRAKLGRHHQSYLTSLYNLAINLDAQGKYEEAEGLHREAVAGRRKKFGDNHVDTATVKENLAITLKNQGKFEESVRLHREALIVMQELLGSDHPTTLLTLNNLKIDLAKRKKAAQANPTLTDSVDEQ